MPELPEIAQSRKYLNDTVLQKKIAEIKFNDTILLQAPKEDFTKALAGKKFTGTKQLGKYLLLESSGDQWLVFHFGMTGKLEFYNHEEHPKYSHMIIRFKDHSNLSFVCRRKLGKVFLTKGVEEFKKEHSLGEDALNLSQQEFLELLREKRGSIKAALTDQHVIAGIGNVYSDEILYQCEIHPKFKTEKLSAKEKEEMYEQMNKILKAAIENEGKRWDLPDNYLTPHRKEGADCSKCSGKIKKISVAGRSTYFCPSCQEEKS